MLLKSRPLIAEFLGTFVIVFVPVAASCYAANLMAAAIVSGLSVMIMVYALGPISGAHFNPAVSLGFLPARRFPARMFLPYVACQVLGGLGAALLCTLIYGQGHGTHVPSDPSAFARNIGTEFIVTFFLMFVIMAVVCDEKGTRFFPSVVIGLTVVMGVLVGGPITGGSMNPARSLGPAVFAGGAALSNVWLYLLAPPLGAVAAALLYSFMVRSPAQVEA